MALQNGRLRIRPARREAGTLTAELQTFRMKLTDKAHDTYGAWREGQHDDLVLATALALWAGERVSDPPYADGSLGQALIGWWATPNSSLTVGEVAASAHFFALITSHPGDRQRGSKPS